MTRFVGGIEVLVSENATRRQAAGTIVKKQGSTRTLSYVFTDHLGSVSAIVGANAVVQQRQSFDAYGARREPSNWQSWTLIQQFGFETSYTRKGFTGHEGVERTGLIHFGGRLYDPRLGRFVQADPLVEDANLVNGLNRYSYVLNNPLSLTDPTGYLSWSEARPAVAIVVNIVLQNYVGAYGVMAQMAIGATSGAIAGGSRGAVQGAFSAALFYGIGNYYDGLKGSSGQNFWGTELSAPQFASKIALHGIAGGVMNVLGGGKFGHGFVSAAGTQLVSPAIDQIGNGAASFRAHRIVVAAVVGGTLAEATGGKFANGAVTGAFSRAFNDENEDLTTDHDHTAEKTKVDDSVYATLSPEDRSAIRAVNRGLSFVRRGLDALGDGNYISSWNELEHLYYPAHPYFIENPRTRAFRDPLVPGRIYYGRAMAQVADPSLRFGVYHGAEIAQGGDRALYFVVAHEFGHHATAGQGSSMSSREIMANQVAFTVMRASSAGSRGSGSVRCVSDQWCL